MSEIQIWKSATWSSKFYKWRRWTKSAFSDFEKCGEFSKFPLFRVSHHSGKEKKDIHEDILDDDIDIKVESKKFDEKISPRYAAIFAGRSRPQTLKNGKFDHKLLHFEVKVLWRWYCQFCLQVGHIFAKISDHKYILRPKIVILKLSLIVHSITKFKETWNVKQLKVVIKLKWLNIK